MATTKVVTTSNVSTLARTWQFRAAAPTQTGQPAPAFDASPTVYGGKVFIGSKTGVFYALNETTGVVVWSKFLGFVPKLTCNARGITATAAVAVDPTSGKPTVYVAGGDGYLYALDAASGAQVWRNVIGVHSPNLNDYYDWSSPTIANGSVYIGVSSQCDNPFVRGAVKRYSLSTGTLQGT